MVPTTPRISPVALLRRQYRQELHDQLYHNDIYSLPLRDRLSHLALHHTKYITYAATVGFAKNDRRIIDGIICCMSMLNACNTQATHPMGLGRTDPARLPMRLLERLEAIAKTIEDYDHMVMDGGRAKLGEQVDEMLGMYLRCLYQDYLDAKEDHEWDLWVAWQLEKRLVAVEEKHMFHDQFRAQIAALMDMFPTTV